MLRCSRCLSAYYCTKDCQRADWKTHKKSCKSHKLSANNTNNNNNNNNNNDDDNDNDGVNHLSRMPFDVITCVFEFLNPRDMSRAVVAVAKTIEMMEEMPQHYWRDSLMKEFPWFEATLHRQKPLPPLQYTPSPPPLPSSSWKQRYLDIISGKWTTIVQVINREWDKYTVREEFLMSAYNALCTYAREGVFMVCYENDGRGTIAEMVHRDRLRAVPPDDNALYEVRVDECVRWSDLYVGRGVEIQWKQQRAHPFGWWYGRVAHADAETKLVRVKFEHYGENVGWHEATVRFHDHTTSTTKTPPPEPYISMEDRRLQQLLGMSTTGLTGGIRIPTAQEEAQWMTALRDSKRHLVTHEARERLKRQQREQQQQ